MIDSFFKKQRKQQVFPEKPKPIAEIGTMQMWNIKKPAREACLGHIHNRKMFSAYNDLVRLEKKEKKMRDDNYF